MEVINWKENKEVRTICKDSNEKNKNIFGVFLRKFPKITIYIWIQQFLFGRDQKYLWKRFYTVKKPLKNRAIVDIAMTMAGKTWYKVRPSNNWFSKNKSSR